MRVGFAMLNYLFLPALLLIFCYCIGCTFKGLLTQRHSHIPPLVIGFMLLFGSFQIISMPFMLLSASLTALTYTVLIFYGTAFVLSFIIASAKTAKKISGIKKHGIREMHTCTKYFAIAALVLIAVQIAAIFILSHGDADDSLYIAQTNTILEANRITNIEPTTGNPAFSLQGMYKYVGYELLFAVICRATSLEAAVLYHSIIPLFLIIVHFSLMFALCRSISHKYRWQLMLAGTFIDIFGGYSVYSAEAFLQFRLWQGKSLLVNIALPLLLLIFIEVFKNQRIAKSTVVFLSITTYAAFCFSTVSLFIFPLAYAGYAFVFFVRNIYLNAKKTPSGNIDSIPVNFLRLCIPMIAALPYVALKYLALRSDLTTSIAASGADSISYINILKTFNGPGIMLIIFAIALVVIAVLGNTDMKYIYALHFVFLALTILNPLFCSFIAGNITGIDVYWRVFWLLIPSYTMLTALGCLLERSENKYYRIVLAIITAAALVSGGRFIFTRENFDFKKNPQKLESYIPYMCDAINEHSKEKGYENNPYLLAPIDTANQVRQYTGKINLVWIRYLKSKYSAIGSPEKFTELEEMCYSLYDARDYSIDIAEKLYDYNCTYLTVYNDETGSIFDDIYECVYKDDLLSVYDITSLKGDLQ